MKAGGGMRISVVGGGSTYTPELVDGLGRRAAELGLDELVLMDPDEHRLQVVGGLAGRMLDRLGFAGRLELTSDLGRALTGAAFVLVQLRVGGMAARLLDETIPLPHGFIGQETTGPGGFAKALRTIPVVLAVAEETRRRAAPDAWLIDFTNPAGVVTQALLDAGHRAVGLCNVPIGTQREAARHFGVGQAGVLVEHAGLNHLSWTRRLLVDGEDRLSELLEATAEQRARELHVPPAFLRRLGAIPSGYLRYYYATGRVLEEQLRDPPRAREVMAVERELLALYADPALHERPDRLALRGGAWYSEAAAQLIASLHTGAGDVQVVNTRNAGALPGLDDDDVVEVPCRIGRDGPDPLRLAPLAPSMHALVAHAKAYERLAVGAALSGDRGLALEALATNPLVREPEPAQRLLDELLEAGRAYLPAFFPEG